MPLCRVETFAPSLLEKGTWLNVKPAVGFTLPSAGVTPAPSVKVRNAKLRAARYFALRGKPGRAGSTVATIIAACH
jgi:hypothetical protein